MTEKMLNKNTNRNPNQNQTKPKSVVDFKQSCVFTFIDNAYMSLVMRKPDFCICENKDADQLRGNREADQRLCFRYIDSTIPLLSKYEISSL